MSAVCQLKMSCHNEKRYSNTESLNDTDSLFKQPLSESATGLPVSVSDRVSAPDSQTDHFDKMLMLKSEN